MTYKNIANLIPTLQAVSLTNANLKDLKKKKKSKDMIKSSVRNIIGTDLIKSQAQIVGGL